MLYNNISNNFRLSKNITIPLTIQEFKGDYGIKFDNSNN